MAFPLSVVDEEKSEIEANAHAYGVRAEAALLEVCGETDKDKYK